MAYEFVTSIVRYRDTETGRFVPRSTVIRYSNMAISAGSDAAAELATLVSSGQISPADWVALLREEIKATFIQEAILGKGGRDNMTQSDWGTVGRALRDQYAYLDGFQQDIEDGLLSEGQIRARSHLYFLASKAAFERAQAAAWGIELPGYPTVDTICQTGDKCYWQIRRMDEHTVLASWIRTASESCPTCIQRADDWAELTYIDGVLQNRLEQRPVPKPSEYWRRSGLLAGSSAQVAVPL